MRSLRGQKVAKNDLSWYFNPHPLRTLTSPPRSIHTRQGPGGERGGGGGGGVLLENKIPSLDLILRLLFTSQRACIYSNHNFVLMRNTKCAYLPFINKEDDVKVPVLPNTVVLWMHALRASYVASTQALRNQWPKLFGWNTEIRANNFASFAIVEGVKSG